MKSNFLGNALIVAALIVLVMKFTGSPTLRVVPQNNTTVETYARETLVALDNAALEKLLKNGHQKTLFFIYASWCPVCKKQFPVFVEVSKLAQIKNTQVVAFSLDEDPYALAKFLLAQPEPPNFIPYIYKRGIRISVLAELGSQFNNKIPFTSVIGPQGEILSEFEGNVKKSPLLQALGI